MAKQPEVIRDKACMRSWSRSHRWKGKILALVPTMGFLHQGHLSLIREAKAHADVVVVSIYVNPGQFAPSEDLAFYPSDLHGDLQKLADAEVDAAFCPLNLYDCGSDGVPGEAGSSGGDESTAVSCLEAGDGGGRGGHETWIRVERLEKGLCGKSRPLFFRGVTTVVAKLFNIVEPDVAVFGKKDYQQWRIICRMVRDLDFGVKVIGSEIVREADGLAMSSRNVHLSPEEREKTKPFREGTDSFGVSTAVVSKKKMNPGKTYLQVADGSLSRIGSYTNTALSINRSLLQAKFSVQKEKHSCQGLKNLVVQAITKAGGRIDYVEIAEQETLIPVKEINSSVVVCVAAWFGNVRLIDNMEINV